MGVGETQPIELSKPEGKRNIKWSQTDNVIIIYWSINKNYYKGGNEFDEFNITFALFHNICTELCYQGASNHYNLKVKLGQLWVWNIG